LSEQETIEGDEFRQIVAETPPGAQAKLAVSVNVSQCQDLEFKGGNGFLNSDGLRGSACVPALNVDFCAYMAEN